MPSPHQKLRIIVGGMVGQFPLGGVAWDYLHYVIGLHQLGHDVYYHEDTWVWPFNPIRRTPTESAAYTVDFLTGFFKQFAPDLQEKWHYVLLHETHYGMTAQAFSEVAKTADVFLNVSGAGFFPDDLNPNCAKVFLDTDPGYNQIMLHERFEWSPNVDQWARMVGSHDRHFTYAENIYGADCVIPRMDFNWQTTRCVVTLPEWVKIRALPLAPNAPFTTVMTWDWFKGKLLYKGVEYGTKLPEYQKFQGLPLRLDVPLALAVGSNKSPYEEIHRDGWKTLDGFKQTATPQAYQNLIARSAGEWSVAKNVYVATRSGWFSCRTACYLAAGRPAVVQDTGWSKFVPAGDGLRAFNTMEEAIAGLTQIAADPVRHRARAYEIAREYLAPDRVLSPMIDAIFAQAVRAK